MTTTGDSYRGFEQGPIRPPSEAFSLLVRVTRNCPWNKCTFCPVYKETRFSTRPVADVLRDIDAVHAQVEKLRHTIGPGGRRDNAAVDRLAAEVSPEDAPALSAAAHWLFGGGLKSVFLQDANSLVIRPDDLIEILMHLRRRFPQIERITSYARSQTVAARKDEDLRAIRAAGLDRLHLGLESGCDEVLKRVRKGVTKEQHIRAGQKARAAGFEVSEYYMPGLGGAELSEQHAVESADALNQINPHFIRLRTLAIPHTAPMYEDLQAGRFTLCTGPELAHELLTFVKHLDGIDSHIVSDHILNLFGDFEGILPRDKDALAAMLREFLDMDPQRQARYQVGRRLGLLEGIRDMDDAGRMSLVEANCRRLHVTPENVEKITARLATRFI